MFLIRSISLELTDRACGGGGPQIGWGVIFISLGTNPLSKCRRIGLSLSAQNRYNRYRGHTSGYCARKKSELAQAECGTNTTQQKMGAPAANDTDSPNENTQSAADHTQCLGNSAAFHIVCKLLWPENRTMQRSISCSVATYIRLHGHPHILAAALVVSIKTASDGGHERSMNVAARRGASSVGLWAGFNGQTFAGSLTLLQFAHQLLTRSKLGRGLQ